MIFVLICLVSFIGREGSKNPVKRNCVWRGYCSESGNEWCGVQCSVRKNRLCVQEKNAGLTPWACGICGGWHFPISSKPFSGEVAVYEKVALSGSYPKLKVGFFHPAFTGGTERPHKPNGNTNPSKEGRWGSNGRHASEAICLKRDEDS